MKLDNNNGIAAFISEKTDGKADVYLIGETLSIYYFGSTRQEINRLKILVSVYIDKNMMMQSYAKVNYIF